jgi:hypothetical protein
MKNYRVLLVVALALALLGVAQAPACQDRDRDGVDDSTDNCFGTYNPLQADENGNAVGDACDPDTPMHDYTFDVCYLSTLTPQGPGATLTDVPTAILANDDGRTFEGRMLLPPDVTSMAITGPGSQNGRDIWFMIDTTQLFTFWGVLVEGTETAVDDHNVVQSITGSYVLLDCPNCFGNPDDLDSYVNWTQKSRGVWTANVASPDECGNVAPVDDDTVDDDTVDDDTVDDDAVDDDATPDDDSTPPAGDDDNGDNGGCGC